MAWRMLRREWRAGEIRIVLLALIVATTSLVSVTALSDRLNRAFEDQGGELLAADLVVKLPEPPPASFIDEAGRRGIAHTLTTEFRSVVVQQDETLLTEVKAVGPGYPLRGELSVSIGAEGSRRVSGPPPPGEVWVDTQLLARLGATVGGALALGHGKLAISGVITFEPDRGGMGFSLAPRVMMNAADLEATGLVGPGSRVRYRWMLAGEGSEVEAMRGWLQRNGVAEGELEDVRNARPRFRSALERGTSFLSLATLVSVLLAGIAISRASQYYARRHWDHAAVMRCLGATQSEISRIYVGQLIMLSLAGGLVGSLLGYLAQQVLIWILPAMVSIDLPLPSLKPLFVGLAASLMAVLGFGLPAVARLRDVPAMRVIRRELGAVPPRVQVLYGAAAAVIVAFVFWLADGVVLALWIVGGTAATLLLLAGAAALMVRVLGRWRGGLGASWRFGIGSLVRRGGSTVAQTVALGVGVMGLLLLTVVRTDLFNAWDERLPADTPNHFLINIQSDQVPGVQAFLEQNGVGVTRLTPLVRARLAAINGEPVDPDDYEEGFARRMVQRAANLSWLDTLPDDNELVAGPWWDAGQWGEGLVSVERDYAEALGLVMGDILTYRVADRSFDVRVLNLREVSWDSFSPNFFLIVPPDLLTEFPQSYITSFYLPAERGAVVARLIERFPNITDIDVGAVLQQVRRLMDRVNWSLQFIFVFAILAGVLVLVAAVQTTRAERRREIAVLRALGAQQGQLRLGLLSEFAVLGLLSGLLGAAGAGLIGFGLAEFLFEIPYQWSIGLWLSGLLGAAAGIAVIGYLASRPDIRTTAWQVLRQSE
jgi:putative ABC transport system permease protein